MPDKNDINSTEKLLNTIRGKKENEEGQGEKPTILLQQELAVPAKKASRFFRDKRRYTIGVDISDSFIKLVKTLKSNDGIQVFVDQKIIPYDEKIVPGSLEFNSLLKSSLLSIGGNINNCDIWALISTSDVNIHHIKIPPVPKKQMENAIYWAAKKETSFDDTDDIFDFEIQDTIIDQGIPKHSIMVYTAPREEIKKCRALFANMGISLAGITIVPFAIQNLYRSKWLSPSEKTTATLFIGNEFSRIDIYSKNNLVMTRGIKTGVSSMIESIAEALQENKSKSSLIVSKKDSWKILCSIGSETERLKETDIGFGLKDGEIFRMMNPAIERLVRQIERTLQYYTTSNGQERVEKLYISSLMNISHPISAYISDQLGLKTEIFDPFLYQINNRAIESITLDDRVALSAALGLALSDIKRTPNFIFTYKEKNQEINLKRINRTITAAFAAMMIACIITIIYQGINVAALNKQKAALKKDLALASPLLSQDRMMKLANEVKIQRNISRQYAERYQGAAVIGEISSLTPPNIKLINLTIMSASKEKAIKPSKETIEGMTMEGIIIGDRNMLDSSLAQYIMNLSNSKILRQVSVNKNSIVKFRKNDVLQFVISAKIGK